MPTVVELGRHAKKRFPGIYDDVGDYELGLHVKTKYPEAYGDFTEEAERDEPVEVVEQGGIDRSSAWMAGAPPSVSSDVLRPSHHPKISGGPTISRREPGFLERMISPVLGSGTALGRAFGTSGERYEDMRGNAPFVRFESALPYMAPESEVGKAGAGALRGGLEFMSGLTSPETLLLIAGTGGLGALSREIGKKGVAKLLSLGFSAHMLNSAFEQVPEFRAAAEAGDTEEAARVMGHIVGSAGFSALALKHGAKREPLPMQVGGRLERYGEAEAVPAVKAAKAAKPLEIVETKPLPEVKPAVKFPPQRVTGEPGKGEGLQPESRASGEARQKEGPAPVSVPPKVEAPTPAASAKESQSDFFDRTIAQAQRGEPEAAMRQVQHTVGGGVLNPVVEHVGDLTHRMTERVTYHNMGYEAVKDKVHKALRVLEEPYGFEREMGENVRSNARSMGRNEAALQAKINKALEQYSEAHKKIPVVNEMQRLARGAAIAVGNNDFATAKRNLHALKDVLDKGPDAWVKRAREVLAPYPDLAKPAAKAKSEAQITISERLTPTPEMPSDVRQGLYKHSKALSKILAERQDSNIGAFSIDSGRDSMMYTEKGLYKVEPDGSLTLVDKLSKTGWRTVLGRNFEPGGKWNSYNPKALQEFNELKAERARKQKQREADVAAKREAEQTAYATRQERVTEIDAGVKTAKFKKAPVKIPLRKEGETAATATANAWTYKGLAIHRRIVGEGVDPKGKYVITHQASGLSIMQEIPTLQEAKVMAYRMSELADFTAGAKELTKQSKAMAPALSAIRRDAYAELPAAAKPARKPTAKPTSETLGMGFGPLQRYFEGQKKPTSEVTEWTSPKVEQRVQASKTPPKAGVVQRVQEGLKAVWGPLTRTYEHLPRGKNYGGLIFQLKQLEKAPGMATHTTLEGLKRIIGKMDEPQYNTFMNKVLADDMVETASRMEAKGKTWSELGYGVTPEILAKSHPRFTEAVGRNAVLREALGEHQAAWKQLRDDYIAAKKLIGEDVSYMTRKDYFPHFVLEYNALRTRLGLGTRKLKKPAKRGFERKRSEEAETLKMDYEANYLESSFQVMAQMRADIAKAKALHWVQQSKHNIAPRVKAELKKVNKERKEAGQERMDIEAFVRDNYEGYRTWQPKEGSVFYAADTIPAKVADAIRNSGLEQLIGPEQLRKAVVMGGRRDRWVLPNEVAETLDNLGPKTNEWTRMLTEEPLRYWKIAQLVGPERYIRYNLRNLSGDAEASFVGNPSAFKQVPRAVRDLYRYYRRDEITPELKEWFDRGGLQTLLQAQEMGDIRKIEELSKLFPKEKGPMAAAKRIAGTPGKVYMAYWRKARVSTDFRESILRYANYLDYMRQMEAGGGKPRRFGASIPEEVMGLESIQDRAFKMSNDLLGAYDEISVAGQQLRRKLIPFWSFQEINFRRYRRMAINASREGETASALGRKLLGKVAFRTPYVTYRVGVFGAKAAALWAALHAYNTTQHPEAEADLPDDVRSRPHITFGRTEDGKTDYFSRVGAMSDLREWFGEDWGPTTKSWLNGELSLPEAAAEYAKNLGKGVMNKAVQGVTPIYKVPAELIGQMSSYPDVTKMRLIRDRTEYLFSAMGLRKTYRALAGKPTAPLPKDPAAKALEIAKRLTIYQIDTGQTAYWNTADAKRRFQKEVLKRSIPQGFSVSERGNALYNFRAAVRLGDEDAQQKYLDEFVAKGREGEDIARTISESLERMHPLSGLSPQKGYNRAFIEWLDEEGREELMKAMQYYETVLLPQPQKMVRSRSTAAPRRSMVPYMNPTTIQ